jgi:hypothetical protein
MGQHMGQHMGEHMGEHVGEHMGEHMGEHVGEHVGRHMGVAGGTFERRERCRFCASLAAAAAESSVCAGSLLELQRARIAHGFGVALALGG